MKSCRVLALCLSIALFGTSLAAISADVDYGDADYIFASKNRGTLTTKYILARNSFKMALTYINSVLTPQTKVINIEKTTVLDYTLSPRSGRTINARTISPGSTFFYFDAYCNMDDTTTLTNVSALTNSTAGRPNACLMSINLNALNHTYYAINYTLFTTFVHDIYDCLLFNDGAWTRFLNNSDVYNTVEVPTPLKRSALVTNMDFDGSKRNFFTLDQGTLSAVAPHTNNVSIVTWLKAAYRSDATGVLMEDNGDETGFRFEHGIYYADITSPLKTQPKLLTKLGPNLGLASGWYTFNGAAGYQFNSFLVAKSTTPTQLADLDPNFQTKGCLTSSALGYCTTENEMTCSEDGLYKLKCIKDPVGGSCMMRVATDFCQFRKTSGIEAYETYGERSRCVMIKPSGGVSQPSCVNVTAATSATAITIQEGSSVTSVVTCDGVGNTKSMPVTTSAQITCPGSVAFLATYQTMASNTPKDCSGNGIFLSSGDKTLTSGGCTCFTGYSAPDCANSTFDERVVNPVFVDPYNATGIGLIRLDFSSIQTVALIWTLFTALWLSN